MNVYTIYLIAGNVNKKRLDVIKAPDQAGDCRIVYSIDDEERTVEVVKIGHRGETYGR